jgi:signal transduction histidine kinase
VAVRIPDFFHRYRSDTIAFFLMTQVLLIVLAGCVAWLVWQRAGADPLVAFMSSLAGVLIVQLIFAPFQINIISNPLKVISQAIAHVSKDPIQTPPPDINKRAYEQTGLKAMVQTIYELAVSSQGNAKNDTTNVVAPYQAVFENAPVGIMAFDHTGAIVFANTLAPTHTDSNGKLALELQFEQGNTFEDWLREVSANKVRDTKVWQWIANKLQGEEGRRIFDVVGYYNKAGEAGIEGMLITVDRTDSYRPFEEDMDFMALAAHELRGPITVIRGYLDLIAEELPQKLQPDQQELIDRLQVSAEQLSGYINNILNVSRFDRKHLRLHLHEEQLLAIVKNLIPDLALRAKTRKRRLTIRIPDSLPAIAADASSLSEVLTNLIDNAIKYSKDDGEVVVSASVKDDFVEVTVQDFGIGMPANVVGNLFNKFYRSHRSRQQVGGTGLGLYICKAIIESHGGSIWVRSTEGEGSTFGFTIPIYSKVADKLAKGDNGNEHIIERKEGWIKNHAMYRR